MHAQFFFVMKKWNIVVKIVHICSIFGLSYSTNAKYLTLTIHFSVSYRYIHCMEKSTRKECAVHTNWEWFHLNSVTSMTLFIIYCCMNCFNRFIFERSFFLRTLKIIDSQIARYQFIVSLLQLIYYCLLSLIVFVLLELKSNWHIHTQDTIYYI